MEELTIGQRIAVKRKELGMSQIDLGEKMGVSRQSISKWESDGAIPEIDKLIALSKLFGVSVGWLLGVERDAAPQEKAEAEFSDREWEIIDRLSQPRVPKWLVPLAASAAAVALLATILAGTALYDAHSRERELIALRSRLTELTAERLPEVKLLTDYEFLASPDGDLAECTFRFRGYPVLYEEEVTAELVIERGGAEVRRLECGWDGACHTAEFTLPAQNGFVARFELTKEDGTIRSSQLWDPLLSSLMDARQFGEISVTYNGWGYDGTGLTLENLEFVIEAPELLRDTPDLWTKCDLVVLTADVELGRVDILNRSPYSREANFDGTEVRFSSRIQTIPIGAVASGTKLDLVLECELSSGHRIRERVVTFAAFPPA